MCWGLGGSQTAARVGVLLLEQRQHPGREGGKVPAWKPPGDTLGAQPAGTRKRRGAVCAEEVAQGRGEAGPESPL